MTFLTFLFKYHKERPVISISYCSSVKATLVNFDNGCRPALLVALFVVWFGCVVFIGLPALGLAQDSMSVNGLGQGERDAVRVDSRLEGREQRVIDSRISDQKIGYEERKIRLERRAEELLREAEVSRQKQERFAEEEEQARAESRRREAEDVRRKKRTVGALPEL